MDGLSNWTSTPSGNTKLTFLSDPQIWAALFTLTALEVVLGIDNVIFISIVSARLPEADASRARRLGLIGALAMRVCLLLSIVWLAQLKTPSFHLFGLGVTWRDLIFLGGGLFLLAKGTYEIHHTIEGEEDARDSGAKSFASVIAQIMVLDLVFSLDSIITAVGMTDNLPVMICAIIIAIAIMLGAANSVSAFIERHPTSKMLALCFLLLVGVALIADGLHFHIPRGYLYFAICFSILVESLNLWVKARRKTTKA